jgi:hypothetical protein
VDIPRLTLVENFLEDGFLASMAMVVAFFSWRKLFQRFFVVAVDIWPVRWIIVWRIRHFYVVVPLTKECISLNEAKGCKRIIALNAG